MSCASQEAIYLLGSTAHERVPLKRPDGMCLEPSHDLNNMSPALTFNFAESTSIGASKAKSRMRGLVMDAS